MVQAETGVALHQSCGACDELQKMNQIERLARAV